MRNHLAAARRFDGLDHAAGSAWSASGHGQSAPGSAVDPGTEQRMQCSNVCSSRVSHWRSFSLNVQASSFPRIAIAFGRLYGGSWPGRLRKECQPGRSFCSPMGSGSSSTPRLGSCTWSRSNRAGVIQPYSWIPCCYAAGKELLAGSKRLPRSRRMWRGEFMPWS